MKKITNWFIVALLTLSSCAQEFNYDPTEEINENAQNIFGIIDANQDWRTYTSGTISVTANADLENIAKVQILTESPFFNDQAKILAETEAVAGQTVVLNYDAPRGNTRLIAACVDNKGKYYIKGFNLEDKEVSFRSYTPAATRAFGFTRAAADLPDLSGVGLDFNASFRSYNAIRSTSNNNWKGKNWENDRLWQPTGSGNAGSWTIANSTIYQDAPTLTEDEVNELDDIFKATLYRYDKDNKPRNNLAFINESSRVKFFGNHLKSNGKAAITLCPVQIASTEAYWCDIYYYYYRPEDVPAGTSEADYIKALPKFKAIDVNMERQAFGAITGIAANVKDFNFLRLHEYILPFYGNASEFIPMQSSLKNYGYETNGKFYRIYNYSGNSSAKIDPSNHYITSADKLENLKDEYTNDSDIRYQLWQIFTNPADNTMMLYNVGSKKFLWWNNNGEHIEFKDIDENSLKNYTIYLTNDKWSPYTLDDVTKQKVYIYSAYKNNCVKALIDKGRTLLYRGGTNVSGDYKTTREWTIEEYKYPSATAINDFDLPMEHFPSGRITPPSAKPSAIIPDGYQIGFMIRKNGGEHAFEKALSDKQGCMYGYGELNTEINTYGQFKTAVEFGMELNSPRMATFEANNKVYLCFEEGADTQYSDVIVKLGSRGETGVYMFDDVPETANLSYTMCFEDRPQIADYDMNDVVLRCVRINNTQLQLTLVATGANDQVYIKGIPGKFVSGADLNEKEVHELFGVSTETFVNTETSAATVSTVSGFYEVSENMTIPQFLSSIYIQNYSQAGNEIHVPKKGEAPFALIIPGDFNYPSEHTSIVNAYTAFRAWANNAYNYGQWLDSYVDSKIYTNPFNR